MGEGIVFEDATNANYSNDVARQKFPLSIVSTLCQYLTQFARTEMKLRFVTNWIRVAIFKLINNNGQPPTRLLRLIKFIANKLSSRVA